MARPCHIAVFVGLLVATLGGCKLVANEDGATVDTGVDIFFDDKNFDPDKMAAELWDARVIPYLQGKAGAFPEVIALAATSPDEAGSRYGHRENAEGTPWTLAARLDGRIIAAHTESRASTIDVDTNGDGGADATVQIGPVVRGTALRDSLDFVPFGSFTNQIDYAKFGKSLNSLVNSKSLEGLPRDTLAGRDVSVLGVFEFDPKAALPLVTPAEIKVTEPSS